MRHWVLEEVPLLRDAEGGNYYSAVANQKLGNTATAIEHIQRAVSLEPNNMQYRQSAQINWKWYSWYLDMIYTDALVAGAASAAVC